MSEPHKGAAASDALETPFDLDEGNMDPLIAQGLNQAFAASMAGVQQIGVLIASSNQYWADAARANHTRQSELMGATAAQVLMGNKLANDILAQRSAGQQPQGAGGPGPAQG